MGASSAEIDQEIKDTRGELDKNLEVLERRAARGARVYGLVAAGVARRSWRGCRWRPGLPTPAAEERRQAAPPRRV